MKSKHFRNLRHHYIRNDPLLEMGYKIRQLYDEPVVEGVRHDKKHARRSVKRRSREAKLRVKTMRKLRKLKYFYLQGDDI